MSAFPPPVAALFADPDVMRAVGPAFTRDRAERAAASALRHQHEANGRHRHWVIVSVSRRL